MNPSRVRVALVGAGYIADFHARALRALPGVAAVAVCDRDEARARALADAHGIPAAYGSLEEMIARERPDAAHVLLPPDAHFAVARELLEARVHVLVEKPLCVREDECRELGELAGRVARRVGTSHNFLFAAPYERLRQALRDGVLGQADEVEIVWNKPLPQIAAGPFSAWVLRDPGHVMLEVGPHSFAHCLDLVGEPEAFEVRVGNPVELPTGVPFYRRWELHGDVERTRVHLRFSFGEGYTEHRIHLRGRLASADADLVRNEYRLQRHRPLGLDFDRFAASAAESASSLAQAAGTLGRFAGEKAGLRRTGEPFSAGIARAVQAFYEDLEEAPDPRLDVSLASRVVALAERAAREVELPGVTPRAPTPAPPPSEADTLVLGGSGFIGRELVRQLREKGRAVRLLTRSPAGLPKELESLGLDVVAGDVTDPASVARALRGIDVVYHLARGYGESWSDFQRLDVAPTREIARLVLDHGVRRLVYASSIAVFDASPRAGTIRDETPPHPAVARVNAYARAKVECEALLRELERRAGLPVVVVRPGVVIGSGASPRHFGVGDWPFPSVCAVRGRGATPLPLVLVRDVADALVRAGDAEGIDGRAYNLVGDVRMSADEYLDELERRAGFRLARYHVPVAALFAVDCLKWLVKLAVRHPRAVRPSYRACASLTAAAPYDCGGARRDLGWTPESDRRAFVEEGIGRPVDELLR